MNNGLNVIDVARTLSGFLKDKEIKLLHVYPNTIKTLMVDYIGYVELPNSDIGIYLISKVQQDDLLRYNSQFSKEFRTCYFAQDEIAITKSLSKSLNKIMIINTRKNAKHLK